MLQNLSFIYFGSALMLETHGFLCLSLLTVINSFRTFFEFLWYILMDAQWVMEYAGLAITIAWAL